MMGAWGYRVASRSKFLASQGPLVTGQGCDRAAGRLPIATGGARDLDAASAR